MISKDIDRLKYTFYKGNKINQNDIKALNGFIEYVNQEKERQLNNYQLFAKLFVNTLKNDLLRNDYDYQTITSSLQSVLKIDFDVQLDSLLMDISQHELKKDIDSLSEEDLLKNFKYPKFDTEQMKDRIIEIIQNYIEDED